jgi:hypothetical protein
MKDRLRTNLHSVISSRNGNAAVSVRMRKMRAKGFAISHETVRSILARQAEAGASRLTRPQR